MKNLIEFFVRQSLFGNLLTIAVMIVGIASILLIRREAFPNINFDVVTVQTIFPGATPDDTEKLISNPLEQDMLEVDGIKKLLSVSVENQSMLTIFLDPDQTTEAKGKEDIQNVVDKFTDLPEGAEDPLVTAIESRRAPLIEVTLAADVDQMELRKMAKYLEKEIEAISGVAKIVHRGMRDLEIRVVPTVQKLARYRVSVDELVAALKKQNVSIPAGILDARAGVADSREKFVRTYGEFKTLDDVRKTVVRSNELGSSITVGDVADVTYELERSTIVNRANGQTALTLTVLKKEKADAIDLVNKIKERMVELKANIGPDYQIGYVNDISEYVRNRLKVLTGNMAVGLILVVLLLPFFLPFRFSFIISLGVPFAFLGAIILFYNMGVTINLLTMIGLIIVVGMLVDDAIVVTENAARFVEQGMDPKEAAIKGASQVALSVTASVLTTIVAFAPLMFMSGIFGKFVKFIPMGVIFALIVSLFEAFFVLPGHIASWITPEYIQRLKTYEPTNPLAKFKVAFQSFWDNQVTELYVKILARFLRHRYWVMAGLVVTLAGSLLLATKGMRFILFPPEGVEIFFIRTETHVGTSLAQHSELIRPLEKLVQGLKPEELKNFTTTIGIVQQDPNDPNTRRGSEYGQIAVFLTPENERDRNAAQIIEDLRAQAGEAERLGFKKVTFNRVNPGPPTGKPVSLSIRGPKYEDILPAVADLKKILEGIDGVMDIGDSYVMGKEEIRISVKASEAAAANLSAAAIGNTVRAVYEGIVATTIREIDDEVDVRVIFPAEQRASSAALENLFIPNPQGSLIPLQQIARTAVTRDVAFHEHEGNSRQVRVTADVDVKKTSSLEVNGKIRDLLPELSQKFPGLKIVFGGEDEDTQESFRSLLRAFGVAALGILLILVSTFKSLLQPLVVMMTIPIGLIAVIIAFFIHGMPLSFLAMMGIVALAGVIVNNAIVMVDFVNQKREEGLDHNESILAAARDRLRPIFLTTMTTVFGILPTAYGVGGLDKFVVPIAMALGWGIMFGSLMTTFIFPAALSVLDDFSRKKA
ncbi:MAG: efflux RND transporter permease subunit [Bdellovibrionales bacterium]